MFHSCSNRTFGSAPPRPKRLFSRCPAFFPAFPTAPSRDAETVLELPAERLQTQRQNTAPVFAMFRKARSFVCGARTAPTRAAQRKASPGKPAAQRRPGGKPLETKTRKQHAPKSCAPARQGRPQPKTRSKPRCRRSMRPLASGVQTKKPAESRASGGRKCREKKISAASWRC